MPAIAAAAACVAACVSVGAQEVFASKQARLLTRFGFVQLTGGVIVIKATIDNGTDSLNFIFDTGSGGISLDSETVKVLKVPTTPSERTIRGIAGIRTVEFAYNHKLCLPGLTTDSLNFHINDYSLLSGVYGLKIDGIVGFSFLQRYIVKINFDSQEMDIYSPGDFKYPKGGLMLRPIIAGLPMQNAIIKESTSINSRFYLDTGAGLCLLLSEEFCKDSAVLSPKRKRFKTVTEGLGGKKEMEMTVLSQFKLGNYRFKKLPVYIFNDEFNVTSYPYLAGLIGNDLLRRFNITINYAAREFHLLPNTHYRDPFDYSYTGLGLIASGSEVLIFDIVPGSPADLAGLKIGDSVVGINNSINGNVNTYKTMLQQTGTRARLIIKRNDQLLEIKMPIKKIL